MNDNQSLAGFAPGEAERWVRELRECWRKGDERGAQRHFTKLLERLGRHLDQKATSYFGRRPDLKEDGISEATLLLWRRLTDLRELSGLQHWERRFHQCLKTLLLDAFERALNQARDDQEVADSATASHEDQDNAAPTALESAIDLRTNDALSAILNEDLVKHLPPKHLAAFALHLENQTRAEIASALGCSEKSVYNWVENVKATLRAYYTQEL